MGFLSTTTVEERATLVKLFAAAYESGEDVVVLRFHSQYIGLLDAAIPISEEFNFSVMDSRISRDKRRVIMKFERIPDVFYRP